MNRLLAASAAVILAGLPLLSFTCFANSESIGINKDCTNSPVSQYGMDSITSFRQFKSEPQKFTEALTAFCNKGKTLGDMGFKEANAQTYADAEKWIKSNLPTNTDEQNDFASNFGNLLHSAMMNGFTGLSYPKPPEQHSDSQDNPVTANEYCNSLSLKAAEYSVSQLPPQVKISMQEWHQVKGEFEMVCLAGLANGNSHNPVDSKLTAGLNEVAKEVYIQAYNAGVNNEVKGLNRSSKENASSIKSTSEKVVAEKKAAAEKAAAAKKAATEKAAAARRDILNQGAPSSIDRQLSYDGAQQTKEINKERQKLIASLRNAFLQRIGDTHHYSGKNCTITMWFSQEGQILSTKNASGDSELCSVIERAAKGVRLERMSDGVYKSFRNTTIDFKF